MTDFFFSGKDLAIWICDDELTNIEEECSVPSDSEKPPGYYVVRPSGLFPAPLPQDSEICAKASKLFWFLGVFLAKTLQDNRLVDLPLSNPLLKLICQGEISRQVKLKQSDELMASSMVSVMSEESDLDSSGGSSTPLIDDSWFAGKNDFFFLSLNFVKKLMKIVVHTFSLKSFNIGLSSSSRYFNY